MTQRLFSVIVLLALMLTSCRAESYTMRSQSYYDLFDTLCTFQTYDLTEEEFTRISNGLYDQLLAFHEEVDIYASHEGVTNLYDLNQAAGGDALPISPSLMTFLQFCQEAETLSLHRVNVMIGSVSSLWKTAIEESRLPDADALRAAAEHTDIHSLVLNEEAGSAQITDPQASIDVGALAKGYAARLAKEYLEAQGVENYLLDLGGNVYAYGQPLGTGRTSFTIGLQEPDAPDGTYYTTRQVQNEAIVSSGDYQRYTMIDGVRYHHIVDPDTLYPGTLHRASTIIHEDPAIADMLSTATFLLPTEEGEALANSLHATVIYYD